MQDLAENGRGLFIIRSLSASAVWSREGRMLRVTLRQDIQEEEKNANGKFDVRTERRSYGRLLSNSAGAV